MERRGRGGGEGGLWVERGWVEGAWRDRDDEVEDGGSDGGVVVAASSTRELYLNAVPSRESRGVAKQRACHDRRRR